MVSSRRELCVLLAVTAVASSSFVKADTCSTSQTDDTTTALTQYTDALNNYCAVYPCSDDCVSAMSELTTTLPDCEYVDGDNYHETMQQALDACAAISDGTTASGGTGTTDTSTASSTFASDSSECDSTDMATTEKYINQYNESITANCDSGSCSSDCIATVTGLVSLLPYCIYSDGTNYYQKFGEITSSCMGTSGTSTTGSEGSSATTSGSACSPSQVRDIETSLAAVNTEYTAACTDNPCTSACLDVLDTLSNELPDCVYTDTINYYQSVVLIIDSCESTTTTDRSDSSTGATASSGSESTPSSLRTFSPVSSKDSSSNGSNGAAAAGLASISAVAVAGALAVAQLLM